MIAYTHTATFANLDDMQREYLHWFNDEVRPEWDAVGHARIALQPGDMTRYDILLVRIATEQVAISFLEPYHRCGITVTWADPSYAVEQFRFTDDHLRYPGLTDIVATVIGALGQ